MGARPSNCLNTVNRTSAISIQIATLENELFKANLLLVTSACQTSAITAAQQVCQWFILPDRKNDVLRNPKALNGAPPGMFQTIYHETPWVFVQLRAGNGA